MHYFLFFRLTDEQYRNVIIIISIIVASIILFFVVRFLLIRYVRKTSEKYKSICVLNTKYNFHVIPQTHNLEKIHKSKHQFDVFNYFDFAVTHVEQNIFFYKALIKKAQENADLFELYDDELKLLLSSTLTTSLAKTFFLYKIIEKREIKKAILKPVIAPKMIIINKYTSPKGERSYMDKKEYFFSQILEIYKSAKNKIDYKETKEYQRKLLSPSLRYDILKRDGFRCVICGRTAEDDVKLHVDHIIPVSKGGKTVPENLRTLCDSCNLGKSDKYDENGLN